MLMLSKEQLNNSNNTNFIKQIMKIALCVKQVPDTTDIRWTKNNTIQREGVESVINPYDVYAAELTLKIQSKIS